MTATPTAFLAMAQRVSTKQPKVLKVTIPMKVAETLELSHHSMVEIEGIRKVDAPPEAKGMVLCEPTPQNG